MNKKKLSYDDYGKTIKKLRLDTKRTDEEIQKIFLELKNVINKFSFGDKDSIDFDHLDSIFDLNEWHQVNNRVNNDNK